MKDHITRLCLSRSFDKAQRGNLGDVKPVGEGVFEMREHFGPGWRMYYVKRGETLIVMLGGGDKNSQESDIAKPRFDTINKVCAALGVRLVAQPG